MKIDKKKCNRQVVTSYTSIRWNDFLKRGRMAQVFMLHY